MQKIPIRRDSLDQLQEELKQLKTVERPQIIKAISEAREHGDLSENAEYHAARERQSFVEGRVGELEDVISRAEVIDPSMIDGKTVTLEHNRGCRRRHRRREYLYYSWAI